MSSLFEQWQLGNLMLKNRILKAATYEGKATPTGHLTEQLISLYEQWAESGVGAIITGYAYVMEEEQPNPNMMGIYSDVFLQEYRQLTERVHCHGGKIFLQIVYGGSYTHCYREGTVIYGPSAIKHPRTGVTPKEMDREDMDMVAIAFADAAERAQKSGFDGIELHGAHGYLLSQFLSPCFNKRTDEYGGTIENRTRYLAEVLRAIRSRVDDDFVVLLKINSSDGVEDGLTEEDSMKAISLLEPYLDGVEISGKWRQIPVAGKQAQHTFFGDYAIALAEKTAIPVILTGGNRKASQMQALLDKSAIAGFGVGRALICEPDIITEWRQNPERDSRCIGCNRCFFGQERNCALPDKKL